MKSIRKTVLFIFIFIAGISVAWFLGFKYSLAQKKVSEEVSVLMEKVEKVSKWTTVEAYFSEIYDYKDYYYYDFSPFRKKALIRVKAKVSAGYDFASFALEIDEQLQTITIKEFPKAEILSIDHELDYYDISEGTFNSFSVETYNELNKNAKDYISKVALESDILEQAEGHKDELLDLLKYTVESAGWKIIINPSELLQ